MIPGPPSRPGRPRAPPGRPWPLLRQRSYPSDLPGPALALFRMGELSDAASLAVEGRQRAVRFTRLFEGFDDRGPARPPEPRHSHQHPPGEEDASATDSMRVEEL